MSSRHDSTGYNSLNDSIPLETSGEEGEYDEEAGSTLRVDESESYTQSVYTGTTLHDRSERSSSYHTNVARSPSRTTGLSAGPTTSGRSGGGGGGEYTATTSYLSPSDPNTDSYFYNSNEDYDEGYEYSSTGYGSMTYEDSSLRSPRSSSVMSSTLASLYYESPFVQRAWDTLSFLRRPLFFLAFATGGGSVVGGIGRLAESMQRAATASLGQAAAATTSLPHASSAFAASPLMERNVAQLPRGYPSVPDWLREVRAALPASVERPVRWCLRHNGVPILSDLQEQQWREVAKANVSTQAADATVAAAPGTSAATETAGVKMIPAAVFLPAFSYGVLIACKYILARQNNANAFLYAQQADEEEAAAEHANAADESEGLSAVDATTRDSTVVRDSLMLDEEVVEEEGDEGRRLTVLQSASPDRAASLLASKGRSRSNDEDNNAAQDGAELFGGSDAQLSAIAPANTTLPSTVVLDTSAQREEERSNAVRETAELDAARRSREAVRSARSSASLPSTVGPAASQLSSRRPTRGPAADVVHSPAEVQREAGKALARPSRVDETAITTTTAAASNSMRHTSNNSSLTSATGSSSGGRFRGTVVAALAGDAATTLEVNALVIAAAKYGCRAVLLPQSAAQLPGLLPTPPALTVQYASNVLRAVEQLTQRSALRCIAVFTPSVAAEALTSGEEDDVVDLPQMVHPAEALYIFVAAASAATVAARVAAVTQTHVRTRKATASTMRGADDMNTVVNECFYDRLAKERQERLAELAVNRST